MNKDKFATIMAQIIICTLITCGLASVICLTAKLLSLLF